MKESELRKADVFTLVRLYADAAAGHGKATESGNHRTANRAHDALAKVHRELRSRGRDGEAGIQALMADQDSWVRLWAAAHSLEFAPAAAERVLDRFAHGQPGPVRLNAEYTLRAWRNGELKFP